jgi:uncharacterized phage protein gp47/JayE
MATNDFLKDFDTLLENILTDDSNLDSAPDTTAGSITYIKAACLASMLWGLYRYQDYLAKQIFVDSADTDNLNHHGSVYGITRTAGESDSDYVARILAYLRQPPAGGTKLDYETWSLAVPGVTGAGYTGILTVASTKVQTPQDGLSPGNVSVTLMPNDETQIGQTGMFDLVNSVYDYIDDRRPVTANQLTVQQAQPFYTTIDLTVTAATGVTLDTDIMEDDITAFVNSLKPGDPCYKSKLQSICIQDGAENCIVNLPYTDILPTATQVMRIGSLNVHL